MNLPDLNLFKQNFTSVVITPKRILALKLNAQKTEVEVFAQKTIPPGVIMGYRVMDSKMLEKTIQDLWKENKIKDKFVGVVVPEFATYTKTLTLPSLTDTEVNEALTWQLEDFLPAPIEDVILDWKVIQRTKEDTQVLVVAILKDVLLGFIDAVGKSGLSPLVVETPSLSLERLTMHTPEGKLIIYVSDPEAILVLTKGRRVVASSVVTSENLNIIVSTAQQMMGHYSDVEVKKILISGVGITQDLIQHLHYNLGRSVEFLQFPIKGMLPAQVQDFLIAISLQKKNPVEPASEETINLLPPHWALLYRQKLRYFQFWTLTLITSVICWAAFLTIFVVYMLIGFQNESLIRETETVDATELTAAIATVRAINAQAEKLDSLVSSFSQYQPIINTLDSLKNDGVIITNYSIDMETGLVKITGRTIERSSILDYSLVEFKDSIDAHSDFSNVENFSTTAFLTQEIINFEFHTFYLPLKQPEKQNTNVKLKL